VAARVACLSPFSEETVRGLFKGRHEVEVAVAPDPPAPDAVRELVADADLVIGDKRHKHRLDRSILESMGRCRLIQQPAVGFDVIDHRVAAELGIPVANAAGYNRDAVADWVIMAALNLLRLGAYGDRKMRDGGWPYPQMMGRELGAMTVGIIGLGNVGNAVASRLRGFGCRVLFNDIVPKSLSGAEPRSFEDLLAEADVVCVHVPLDDDTRHLIGTDALARVRPGTILINAARGPVVDEQALVQALQQKARHIGSQPLAPPPDSARLGGAPLDVFEQEPLSADSPLRALENVFLSPHVGGATREAEARVMEVCGANLSRVLDGDDPFNVVNGVTRRR